MVRPCRSPLPAQAAKPGDVIEVLIEADDSLIMLSRQGGEPDVILRYRATLLAQLFSDARIVAGCVSSIKRTRDSRTK